MQEAASAELIKTITDAKLLALNESITSNTPTVTSTPNVGDEAAEVSVTMVTTYQMQGIASDNLRKLVDNDIKKKLDQTKQPITDYGFAKATYHTTEKRSGTDQTIQLKTTATAGTKIDPEALKKEIVGKKESEVRQTVLSHPGVKEVNISFSPFWVSKIPSKTSRTTVIFEQVTSSATPRQ